MRCSRKLRSSLFGRLLSIGLSGLCIVVLSSSLSADEEAVAIQQHLEAGEFGPALKLAQAAPQANARDQWLQKIAQAQAAGGARNGGLATAFGIGNDRTRTNTMNGMGGSPFMGGGQGGQGGAALADFDSLIELITTTVDPDSWTDNGGPGAINEFATGVIVDTNGLLKRNGLQSDDSLIALRSRAIRHSANSNVRRESNLRMVSLSRLERHLQLLRAKGRGPDDVMRSLAGIYKVKYLLVYPESRDVVLAGPAGDWGVNAEGRFVNHQSGRPVLQLDDFVVLLRNSFGEMQGRFSCAIVPRQENLAAAKEFLEASAAKPLQPSQRNRWLRDLRDRLGRQDIEIKGIDPRTRVARVVAEADYHMKLVGMGLEEGTAGVTSYLDSLSEDPAAAKKPLNVLRWWFTLNYEAIRATPERNAFELRGPGAKVQSENELLTASGERVHTGQADLLTSQFSQSFTRKLDALAIKYPVYAELQNIFDMAVIAALLRAEDIPNQMDWTLPHFSDGGAYQVTLGEAPREVESVINHRMINQKQIVAGVSGGVTVDTRSLVRRDSISTDNYGLVSGARGTGVPDKLPRDAWWWD